LSSSSSNGNFNSNDKSKKKIDKKGVVITLIIVIGIVGASFIVWLPQGINQNNGNNNGNNEMIFSNPNDTLVAVGNQFMLLKNELNNQTNSGNNIFSGSNISSSSFSQLKSSIDASIRQNNGLMQSLLHGNPSGALVPNYVNMMNKLKNFSFYLDDLKNMISSAPALTASTTSSKNLTKDLILLQNKWSIR
jgi:hypothetical protein